MSQAAAKSSAPPTQPPCTAQGGKARLVQHVHAGHQAAQPVLESQAVARRGQAQQIEVACKHLQRHARAEVPAGGAQHQCARAAFVVQALHGIAQGGKEGRRQGVEPLGAVQFQGGHAGGVVEFQVEEVVHGVAGSRWGAGVRMGGWGPRGVGCAIVCLPAGAGSAALKLQPTGRPKLPSMLPAAAAQSAHAFCPCCPRP
jgi:hypothetical protein